MAQILIYGYTNIGKIIANNLLISKDEIIIVDNSPQACDEAKHDGFSVQQVNLSYDFELKNLGIGSTIKYFFCVYDYIDLNLFIILTARMIDTNLIIIASAKDAQHRNKLILAGANETIAFEEGISYKIATMLTDKMAFKVYEGIFYQNNDFYIKHNITTKEILISANSVAIGRQLSEIDFLSYNIILIGFYSSNSGFLFKTQELDYKLLQNDVIIVVKKKKNLDMFFNYINGNDK